MKRRIRQWASAAAAAAAAWLVASNGLAAHLARTGDPASAVALAPDADRLARYAEQLFGAGRFAEAGDAARHALALSPLQTRAARVLGQAELALGHEDAGIAAMNAAARGGWRDSPTQGWMMQAALASGDYAEGLRRADALIRREAVSDTLFGAFRDWFAEPGFRAALVARLADKPIWRGKLFLDWRHANADQLPGIVQLVANIDRSAQATTDLELFPLTERVLELDQAAQARALWRPKAPRAGWSSGNLLYDGRFEVAGSRAWGETPPRFEWWVDPDRASLATVGPAPNGRGSALRIAGGTDPAATYARQALLLAPGRYRLVARIFALPARDVAAITFALRCYPADRDLPLGDARIDPLGGDQLRYAIAVAIPGGCPRQDLIVKASGTSIADTLSIGEIAVVPAP